MTYISIIIPNYNHSPFLKKRIDSVLNQTYQNFELIILDDFSTDNSRNIIETYRENPKISAISYSERNSGSPFKQWRRGIELAKGDWIWIAESDDFSETSFLQEAVDAINNHPSIGIFYCDSFIIDKEDRKFPEKYSERKNRVFNTLKWSSPYYKSGIDEINENLKFDCTINNISSMVFSKILFYKISGIEEYSYYGDWFFAIKASFLIDIFYSTKPLNYYRKHKQSHLHRYTSLVTSRKEYFSILKLLYYHKQVSEKKKLIKYFVYNHLCAGILQDGIKTFIKILREYIMIDKEIAFKVILEIILIKTLKRNSKKYAWGNKDYSDSILSPS